jgi:hypothetical protein
VAHERARGVLEEAENRGMEVSQALFELEDLSNSLTRARAAIHSFHTETVAEALQPGFVVARTAWDRGLGALAEHRFRRVGLAYSSAIILALIASLLLKIRDTGARRRAGETDDPAPHDRTSVKGDHP